MAAEGGGVERAEAFFGEFSSVFGFFAFGGVEHEPDHAFGEVGGVDGSSVQVAPDDASGFGPHGPLGSDEVFFGGFGIEAFAEGVVGGFVDVEEGGGAAEHFFGWVFEDFTELRVDLDDDAAFGKREDAGAGVVQDGSIPIALLSG